MKRTSVLRVEDRYPKDKDGYIKPHFIYLPELQMLIWKCYACNYGGAVDIGQYDYLVKLWKNHQLVKCYETINRN